MLYGSSIRETFNVTHSRLLPHFFGQARDSLSSLNVRMENSSESQSAGQTSYPLINSSVLPGISLGYAAPNPFACACSIPPRRCGDNPALAVGALPRRRLCRPDPRPTALWNTPAASAWSGRPRRMPPGADATPSRGTGRPARNTPRRMSSTLSRPVSARPLPPPMPPRWHAASCQKRPPRPQQARRPADIEDFQGLPGPKEPDRYGRRAGPRNTKERATCPGGGLTAGVEILLLAVTACQGAAVGGS